MILPKEPFRPVTAKNPNKLNLPLLTQRFIELLKMIADSIRSIRCLSIDTLPKDALSYARHCVASLQIRLISRRLFAVLQPDPLVSPQGFPGIIHPHHQRGPYDMKDGFGNQLRHNRWQCSPNVVVLRNLR
jgi:hypothetical protein